MLVLESLRFLVALHLLHGLARLQVAVRVEPPGEVQLDELGLCGVGVVDGGAGVEGRGGAPMPVGMLFSRSSMSSW